MKANDNEIPGTSALWVTAIFVTHLSAKPSAYLLAQVTSETTKTTKSVIKGLAIVTTEPITTRLSKAAMVGQTPQQSGTLVIEK